jgi:predicted aconitase
MSIDRFPVGLEMDVSYPAFRVSLTAATAADSGISMFDPEEATPRAQPKPATQHAPSNPNAVHQDRQ